MKPHTNANVLLDLVEKSNLITDAHMVCIGTIKKRNVCIQNIMKNIMKNIIIIITIPILILIPIHGI